MKTDQDSVIKLLEREISEDHLINWLQEMISVPSENPFDSEPRPGFREQELAEYYMEQMNELGMEVYSRNVAPGRPNIFGVQQGQKGGPTLMLCGHLDTVPTEGYIEAYTGKASGGKVYGRGACDMKAGLACYLEVIRILREASFRLGGTIILCGVADEEYRMIGSKEIGLNGPKADQAVIAEPSSLSICPANKGQLSFWIRTYGRSVHSSIPEKGENAIERMARVLLAMSDYNSVLASRSAHPLCGHGRYSPGVIRGGEIVSSVPNYCELEIDRRTLPGETRDSVYSDIRIRLDELTKEDPGFQYDLSDPSWEIPANDISVNEPVVRSLLRSYLRLTGSSQQLVAFPGATDAPNLGFPAVVCGPGSLAQAHSNNEYVEVSELMTATRMYLSIVIDLLA